MITHYAYPLTLFSPFTRDIEFGDDQVELDELGDPIPHLQPRQPRDPEDLELTEADIRKGPANLRPKRPHVDFAADDYPDLPPHLGAFMLPSKRKKMYSAGNHLQKFLESHQSTLLKAYPNIVFPSPMDADNLPYELISNDDFVGRYLQWLAEEATSLEDPSKKLMLSTIIGYAGAFKVYYVEKYRLKPSPPSFDDKRWSIYLSKMSSIKGAYCFCNGLKIKTTKASATENHLLSMSSICMWEGKYIFTFHTYVSLANISMNMCQRQLSVKIRICAPGKYVKKYSSGTHIYQV